jgi:glutathione S-transferase
MPFARVIVDFGDEASRAAFAAIWPMAKMPVLVDGARGATVAESTVLIEYLDTFYPGRTRFVPADPDLAWRVRFWERFFDHYVHEPMQKIVLDRLRPEGSRDSFGVEQARAQLRQSYAYLERELAGGRLPRDGFTLADCAAAPALFYADIVEPIAADQKALSAYYGRLMARPSTARVLREAEPYFHYFPLETKPTIPAASGIS